MGFTSVIGCLSCARSYVQALKPWKSQVGGGDDNGSRGLFFFLLAYPRKRSQSQTHRAVTVLYGSHCFSVPACWGGFHRRGKVSSFQECKAACLWRILEEGACHPRSAWMSPLCSQVPYCHSTSLISPSTGGLCVVSEAGPGAPTCCMKKSLVSVWLNLVINSRHKKHLASGKAISAARGMITAAHSSYWP